MIDLNAPAPISMAERRDQAAPHLEPMRCARCGNALARVHLTVGSVVEQRCHHSIRRPDGKRETCGWVTTVRPTR